VAASQRSGTGQAAGVFEVVVVPAFQLAHGVALEEVGADVLAGDFPGGGLGAAFAKLEGMRVRRLGPGAADAGEAVRLVLLVSGLSSLIITDSLRCDRDRQCSMQTAKHTDA
jgi:hypothetical protein